MLRKAISAGLFLFVLNLVPARGVAKAPDWLRSVAEQPAKKYADDVNVVVLLDDQEATVTENGEIMTHQRIAYRILRPEGKHYAEHVAYFDNETKLNYLRGWSITAKGQEYEAKDKDNYERSASTYEVFSDTKLKIIILPGADVGTVVGFEYEQKDRPYLFQDEWFFQEDVPVEKSRYTLHMPASWEYRADFVNHPEIKPSETGNTFVWAASDVPRIEREFNEPPYRALAGHMIVTLFSARVRNQTFKSWNDLGLWYSQLATGMRDASPALSAKAQELAPASQPLWERIRALARFAQHDVRYAAIEIGIGGWRPHPAADIFAHRYGDCKDKATVLSSMLAQIGVKSYYMLVHATRGINTERTPPSTAFNHMILVIQMPDASLPKALPAMVQHPKLGQLLIFDPTNDLVPLGQLPYYEQDSYGLLVTDGGGELLHLPVSSPDLNKLHRTARLKLQPDGTLQGEMEEVRSGYMAMLGRAYLRGESGNDRNNVIQHFLGPNPGNFQVDSFNVENAEDIDKDLVLHYKFTANQYAKNAGPLLLVRPRVVGEMAGLFDATKPRHYAYEFSAPFLRSDSVEITLPEGYKVDEFPNAAKTVVPFAEYQSKTEQAGNVLKYTREYKMETTQVPLERIGELRKLFGQINVDEKNMAVLKKAN